VGRRSVALASRGAFAASLAHRGSQPSA